MNRNLPSNWCAIDNYVKLVMNGLITITEEGQTKVKNDEVNYHHY